MTLAYWILTALLAVVYLFSGAKKVFQSTDQLRPMMGWVDDVPLWLVRLVGVLELLAVAGLVLPPLTGVAPVLAVAAAVGLVLVQIGALVLHLTRGEVKDVWPNVALLALAGVMVWLAAAVWVG